MKAGLPTGLRVVAWSASSLLLAGAAAGTASAATHHAKNPKNTVAKDTTTDTTDTDGTGPAGGPPRMLHGSMTIEKKDGTFETYVSQSGKVTAVSATSITVKSDDNFTGTYAIDDSTHIVKNGAKGAASDVATGDTVMVRGEDEDDAVTADVIFDGKPPAGQSGPGGHRGPGAPGGPGGHGGPPPGVPGGDGD